MKQLAGTSGSETKDLGKRFSISMKDADIY